MSANRLGGDVSERPHGWHADSNAERPEDPLAGVRSAALRAAATAVAAEFAREEGAGDELAIRSALGELTQAITSGDAEVLTRLRARPDIRPLLERLRAEVIREWQPRVATTDPAEIARLLAGIEQVAVALDPAGAARTFGFPTGPEFVAGVAHDLRSPLTSILFLAETLHSEQSGAISELQRRQLGIIYSAALGLVSVASDIIELVRGGDGLSERRPILFSVTEVLESVHDIVRPMAEEKGLRVQLFPPAVDQRMGYPLALSRVLLNLTTNGLKFTESGFVEIACRDIDAEHVEFSVRDTGKGYSPDAIHRLYQPFRRSRDGKKYGFSGTGLGLAISRKLVSALSSRLDVETRPRWGTRFFFELHLPPGPMP